MLLGGLAILIMLMAPKGIWGLVNQRFGLSLFPIGYRVKDV
jgi:branched-chain amino acid transport system permease protein